jgi:membrane protease YdiL (CAAX protease family)
MSDIATATLFPGSSVDQDAERRTSWAACLTVLAATVLVVGGGQLTGILVAQAIDTRFGAGDTRVTILTGPVLAGILQLGFLWLVATWATGAPRCEALALSVPRLELWHWVAVIVGLYAVKALTTVVAVWFTHGGGNAPAVPGGLPIEGLAPFAAIMRSPAWMLLLIGGVIAAIVEELVYRGFLSRMLEGSRLGFWGGALVASVIWAGLHFYYPLSIQASFIALGLCLSWLRAKTGSVYPGMAWHIVNNAVGLLAMKLFL